MPVARLEGGLDGSTNLALPRLPDTYINIQLQFLSCMVFTAVAAVPSATEGILSPDGKV